MRLKVLIEDIDVLEFQGEKDLEILDVCFDSRKIEAGALYVAIPGNFVDGHKYIPQAIEAGAIAIVCEVLPEKFSDEVSYVIVQDARKALAMLASAWFDKPSKEIKLVGVTGTNGKTTVVSLLYQVHVGLGYKVGMLTTIEVLVNDKSYPATHTTPDPMQINRWLRLMVDEGCDYCFMEVSSHAIAQKRVIGLRFLGGIFTNLSHDHLDYHKDFKTYLEVKQSWFTRFARDDFALVNSNDKNGEVMVQLSKAEKYSYGIGRVADYKGKIIEMHFDGMHLQINGMDLWVRLTGRFNASNILAVFGACDLLRQETGEILEQLSMVQSAEGRFDVYESKSGNIGIVDYAHTDDALKNVLETIREVNVDGRQVITIIGAGGNRDREKRPKMGKVAVSLSDKVILTSDNPRSEKPEDIIDEIETGVPGEKAGDVLKIKDREEAIKTACMLGSKKSIILLAGKGHEKYQLIGSERRHFDDKEMIVKYIK